MRHYQVTLTTAGTVYELRTLVKALDPSFRDGCKQLIIQMDDGNSAPVFLGGPTVSSSNYGTKLTSPDEFLNLNYEAAQVGGIYAVSTGNSQLLNLALY